MSKMYKGNDSSNEATNIRRISVLGPFEPINNKKHSIHGKDDMISISIIFVRN